MGLASAITWPRCLKMKNELQPYVQARILGAGVASLVDQLSEMEK